jgi:hypothetical protein
VAEDARGSSGGKIRRRRVGTGRSCRMPPRQYECKKKFLQKVGFEAM